MRARLLTIALAIGKAATQDVPSATPLSIPPSQNWYGNDGQWSTFSLNVGTPFQRIEVLPGTSATATTSVWAVIPQGCTLANPQLDLTYCEKSRGNVFVSNHSTSWSTSRLANHGLYGLVTYEESMLGLGGGAYYGFDTINLGAGLPTLSSQVIAGFATSDFWMGSLGLSPLTNNISNFNDPIPSMLGTLRNMSLVPSTTWAYTAGAIYKEPPVFASLTLGGYDEVRLDGPGISVGFWTDQSRDLLVGLQSITFDTLGSAPLLVEGIYIFIDSLITHLWLPMEVCEAFESNFGLVWDDATSLYLLNSTTHANLRAQNPTFTFTLGTSDTGGNTTTITLPYSAFDLNVTTPNGTSPYFPLKRAENSTQFTLGRVFLQEAYVIADYERQNFTVAQAAFPTGSEQNLIEIYPPGFTVHRKGGLGSGAIAGIAVGGAAALGLIIAAGFWLIKRRRRSITTQPPKPTTPSTAQTYFEDGKDQLSPTFIEYNVPGSAGGQIWRSSELSAETYTHRSELAAIESHRRSELSGDYGRRLHELPAGLGISAAELESPRRVAEMESPTILGSPRSGT